MGAASSNGAGCCGVREREPGRNGELLNSNSRTADSSSSEPIPVVMDASRTNAHHASPRQPSASTSAKDADEWEIILSKSSGKYYFYNKRTKESTWVPPPGMRDPNMPKKIVSSKWPGDEFLTKQKVKKPTQSNLSASASGEEEFTSPVFTGKMVQNNVPGQSVDVANQPRSASSSPVPQTFSQQKPQQSPPSKPVSKIPTIPVANENTAPNAGASTKPLIPTLPIAQIQQAPVSPAKNVAPATKSSVPTPVVNGSNATADSNKPRSALPTIPVASSSSTSTSASPAPAAQPAEKKKVALPVPAVWQGGSVVPQEVVAQKAQAASVVVREERASPAPSPSPSPQPKHESPRTNAVSPTNKKMSPRLAGNLQQLKNQYTEAAQSALKKTSAPSSPRGGDSTQERRDSKVEEMQAALQARFAAANGNGNTEVVRAKATRDSSSTASFGGAPKCVVCNKSAYANESLSYDAKVFHKSCFKCENCNAQVQLKSVAMLEGHLYCKPCFKTIFKTTGGRYDDILEKTDDKRRASVTTNGDAIAEEPAQSGYDVGSMNLKSRLEAYEVEVDAKRREEEFLKAKAEKDEQEYIARPRLSQDDKMVAAQEVENSLLKKQTLEKAGQLDNALAVSSGAAPSFEDTMNSGNGELNLNNSQEFMRATPEQRTEKYNKVLNHLRIHPEITTFTATAADLDDEFATLFAEFLADGHTLTEANLENNRIGEKGISKIAEVLVTDISLKTLKLFANTKSVVAAEALCKALDSNAKPRNKTLLKLTFDFTQTQHRDSMGRALRENYAIAKGWKTAEE